MADLGPAEGDSDHPSQIWLRVSNEGEHRLERSRVQFVATGLLGGFDVSLGVVAMIIVGGSLVGAVGIGLAQTVAAVAFGLGLALIAIGRSELFTENFLVPVVAVVQKRGTSKQVLRLWAYTGFGNVVGVLLMSVVLWGTGMMQRAGRMEFTDASIHHYIQANAWQNFAAAILAGMVMTLFTWLLHATSNDMARIVLAVVTGFLLTAPPLVHIVVVGSKFSVALLSGIEFPVLEALQVLGIGLIGNIIGGVGFVTLGRSAQVLSWPSPSHK